MNLIKDELRLAMASVNRLHFIGIGGVGMSGIAELFHNLGFEVSGSDQKSSAATDNMRKKGIKIFTEHNAKNVEGANVVVVSTAISDENPEKINAKKLGITIIRRAEMLAELMRFKFGVAVAGTHGKTTTTSLIASVLTEGGLDPTYIIGGKLISSARNAKLGSSRILVAEADESDASFLHLHPMLTVVTNIDQDHMETYGGSVENLYHSFVEFIHNLPFYGKVIVCSDDAGVQAVLPKIHRQIVSYGLSEDAIIRAVNIKTTGVTTEFTVQQDGLADLLVTLNMPGEHNVLNALASIAVAREFNANDSSIINALKIFRGIGRRFQQYGEFLVNQNTVRVVDDYGHHPKEVRETIKAVRACCPEKRLVLIFQPHRFTRTRDLFDDFVKVLGEADELILLAVYPAGEEKITGACSRSLAKSIRALSNINLTVVDRLEETLPVAEQLVRSNDLLLVSGAGDVGTIAPQIAKKWQAI